MILICPDGTPDQLNQNHYGMDKTLVFFYTSGDSNMQPELRTTDKEESSPDRKVLK